MDAVVDPTGEIRHSRESIGIAGVSAAVDETEGHNAEKTISI